jgi:hypothetical protein
MPPDSLVPPPNHTLSMERIVTRDTLIARWQEIGSKTTELAEQFPEDRYGYRPAPAVRSFAEQLRHVAFWNQYAAETLRGGSPDGSANDLPAAEFRTKQDVVRALHESFESLGDAATSATIGDDVATSDTVLSYLGHASEHYGQLVIYYRLNGLVPPASRPEA